MYTYSNIALVEVNVVRVKLPNRGSLYVYGVCFIFHLEPYIHKYIYKCPN